MGLTFVDLTVSRVGAGKRARKVTDKFLVDSGASLTVLPEAIWKPLGLKRRDHISLSLAGGRVVTRDIGQAEVSFEGKSVATQVILGEPDDSKLLGILTLEEMGLVLDPIKRTLSKMVLRM